MKRKWKYLLTIVIFLVGFAIYMYGIMIWQDNNTVYTVRNCTQNQKEVIEAEIGTSFPTSALVEEIKYRYTWGNDIPRYYEIVLHMTKEEYQKLNVEENEKISLGSVKPMEDTCEVVVFYRTEGYTQLATWMTEQGEENRGYKNAVSVAWFVVLIVVSSVPLLPYKKIFRNGV